MNLRPVLAFIALSACASAAPDWKADVSPPAHGNHPPLDPTSLDYQVSWKGVLNSGHLHIEFDAPWDRRPGLHIVKAHADSQGAAAAIHPYHFNAWSELNPTTLLPRQVRVGESDKNGREVSEILYFPNRVETQSTTRSAGSGKIKVGNRTFTHPTVFDIFSAMLHIRSQPLAKGDRIHLVVQAGDQPYLLRVRCLGRETHDGRKTIKLAASLKKIDRDTLELKEYKKLKNEATIWLSDDKDRVPLELRADIFWGDVRAVLTSRKKL